MLQRPDPANPVHGVVSNQISNSFISPLMLMFTIFVITESAEAISSFRNLTLIEAKVTGNTIRMTRSFWWEVETLSQLLVDTLDGGPYLSKVFSNAVGAKANGLGNGDRFFMTKVATSHLNFFLNLFGWNVVWFM